MTNRLRQRGLFWLVAAVVVAAGSCRRDATEPTRTTPPDQARAVGLVEITFANFGTANMTASATVAASVAELEAIHAARDRAAASGTAPSQAPGKASFDLTVPAGSSQPATIQLTRLNNTVMTHLLPGGGSVRYAQSTFGVRNAQSDGTPFATPRPNLTFVAVGTANTINGTAVRTFNKPDGSPADPALALQVLPSGLVSISPSDSVVSMGPDILQAMTEPEVAAIVAPPAVTNIFPYGFVTRLVGSVTSRVLPASPPPGQFDGVVTFAFRIPDQVDPSNNPTSVSMIFLALDDSQVRLTESLEEQGLAARMALRLRATTLNATGVSILPAGTLPGQSGLRILCSVRTAGTAAAPTAFLTHVTSSFSALAPNPYALAGSFVSATTNFVGTFTQPVTGADTVSFNARGLQSGRRLHQAYTGNGTATITTPATTFLPGETVEVVQTTQLSCPQAHVAQVRIASAGGQGGILAPTLLPTADSAVGTTLADLNGDGKLDIIATGARTGTVSVFLNNGDGTFGAAHTMTVGNHPVSVAAADLNGDGIIDLAVPNELSRTITVLLGNGDGSFHALPTFTVGLARSIVITDLNGDGFPDLATANNGGTASVRLNNGDGTFQTLPAPAVGSAPTSIAAGDLNQDGLMDLVLSDPTTAAFYVLLGNGDGTFQTRRDFVTAGSSPIAVALGDFNGDGRIDVALSNVSTGTVTVRLGDGTGGFGVGTNITATVSPQGLAVGDINGDGKLDIIVTSNTTNLTAVILGNGDGTFQAGVTFDAGAAGQRSVVFGDLNGDGVLDAVIGTDTPQGVLVIIARGP